MAAAAALAAVLEVAVQAVAEGEVAVVVEEAAEVAEALVVVVVAPANIAAMLRLEGTLKI